MIVNNNLFVLKEVQLDTWCDEVERIGPLDAQDQWFSFWISREMQDTVWKHNDISDRIVFLFDAGF